MHVREYVIQFQQHRLPEGRDRMARALRLLLARTREPLVASIEMTCSGDQRKAEKERALMTPEGGMLT